MRRALKSCLRTPHPVRFFSDVSKQPRVYESLSPTQVAASNKAITKSTLDQMDKSYLLCKPYAVLSAFTHQNSDIDQDDDAEPSQGLQKTLRDVFPEVPTNVYPAGRLDYRSEGLLIVTSNAFFKTALADPQNRLPKRYWVLVQGKPSKVQLQQLQDGMILKGGDQVLPCHVEVLPQEPELISQIFNTPQPISTRYKPENRHEFSWLNFTLEQGLNRQIRRMCALVGLPVLRIIRHQIGPFSLDQFNLKEGQRQELNHKEMDRFWRFFYENKAKSRTTKRKIGKESRKLS